MRSTIKCTECGSHVSLSNIKKHIGSRNCRNGGKQIPSSSKICKFCNIEFVSASGRGVHEVQCNQNPARKVLNLGRLAWNKGLKKETDNRVAKYAKSQRESEKMLGKCKDPEKEVNRRQKISEKAKLRKFGGYRENAGRSKKFKVYDSLGNQTTLQSTYEYAVFEILCELGIRWIRPKALKYQGKNYFADFYLIDFDIWIDPKNNYKARIDQPKIDLVIKENQCRVIVLLENQINKNFISRVI